jgi:hypothetical protein
MALKRTAGNADTKMKRKAYEKELRKLQVELSHLQDWVKAKVYQPPGLQRQNLTGEKCDAGGSAKVA